MFLQTSKQGIGVVQPPESSSCRKAPRESQWDRIGSDRGASRRGHFRVAAVTGANKGIGLAIVRQLALQYPQSPFQSGSFSFPIYLTARSADGGNTTITYHPLDISQTKSIQDFRDYVKKEHPDGVDMVINNAGIALNGFDSNVVKETLQTNYYGSLEATQDFLPLIRDGRRLVNVCSMAGKLHRYSDEIRAAFLEASKKDIPTVTALMQQFQQAVDDGREKEAGFPSAAYAVSKAGEIAATKVIAEEERQRGRNVLVNKSGEFWQHEDVINWQGGQ